MNNIVKSFEKSQRKKLIAFITGGDPSVEMTKKIIIALAEAGVDIIEIGVPFSDPSAEGPVIERANIRGLASKTTVNHLFDMVKDVRTNIDIPILFATYGNLIFAYGKEKFMKNCAKVGIDGVVVPDVPHEEMGEFKDAANAYGIIQISTIAPTSTSRIESIVKGAQGFLYCTLPDAEKGGAILDAVANRLPCIIEADFETPTEKQRQILNQAAGILIKESLVSCIETHGDGAIDELINHVKTVRAWLDLDI